MEADFLREYRIDLVRELPQLSWRRFLVLLAGLSSESRIAQLHHAEEAEEGTLPSPGSPQREAVQEIQNGEQGSAFFRMMATGR